MSDFLPGIADVAAAELSEARDALARGGWDPAVTESLLVAAWGAVAALGARRPGATEPQRVHHLRLRLGISHALATHLVARISPRAA